MLEFLGNNTESFQGYVTHKSITRFLRTPVYEPSGGVPEQRERAALIIVDSIHALREFTLVVLDPMYS